jgi:hypothetical protein
MKINTTNTCRQLTAILALLVTLCGAASAACPAAADGVVYVNANQPLTFILPISSAEADVTTVLGTPAKGTVSRVPGTTATVTYTPILNYHGPDTFQYVVHSPGAECGDATYGTIQVNPCATADSSIVYVEGNSVTFDLPIIHPQSGFTLDALPTPSNGTLTLIPGTTHTVRFTGDKSFFGQAQFTYSINTIPYGSGACGRTEGTIQIRPLVPEAGSSTIYGDMRTSKTFEAPITNPGFTLKLLTLSAQHGTAAWTDSTTPTIEYKYLDKYNGPDVLTYSASYRSRYKILLGEITITGTIRINPCAVAGDLTRKDSSAIQTFDLPIEPGVAFTLDLQQPAHGQVSLVENTTATVTYVKEAGYAGLDSFLYTIYYLAQKNGCGPDMGTVTINSSIPKLTCPVAHQGVGFTTENTSVTIQLPITGKATGLTYTQPAHGTVSPEAFPRPNRLVYTPDPGYTGVDQFTYTASSGFCNDTTSSVVVGVAAPNNCPIATDLSFALDRGTSSSQQLGIQYYSDPDSDKTTVWISTPPLHGKATLTPDGKITYLANDQFEGLDTFAYRVTDGNCSAEAAINVTVNPGGTSAVGSWKTYGAN